METYNKARDYEIANDKPNAIYYYNLSILQGNDLGLKKLEYLEHNVLKYLKKYTNQEPNTDFIELLSYWFGTSPIVIVKKFTNQFSSSSISSNWTNVWFAKNAEQKKIDQDLKKFELMYDKYKDYEPTYLYEYVGLIILYDQIPRNIFRKTPKAYQTDSIAFTHANFLSKFIEHLPFHVNIFIVLAFCHQESLDAHKTCSSLIEKIKNKYSKNYFEITNTLIKIFQNHFDRIQLFGRIPERNAILNRPSTPEEKVYMLNL